MFLSDVAPICLNLMKRVVRHFIELDYVEMDAGESLMDSKYDDARADAVRSLRDFVTDEPDHEEEVRRAILYLLNVDAMRFEQHLRLLNFPMPRWSPSDAHQLLQEMWRGIWGDWRVPDFDKLELDVQTEGVG